MLKNTIEIEFDFLNSVNPLLIEQYKIWQMSLDELVGKEVISIRSGFSGSAGQIMKVEKIVFAGESSGGEGTYYNDYIVLAPTKQSINTHLNLNGWLCAHNEKHTSFVLATDENVKLVNQRFRY